MTVTAKQGKRSVAVYVISLISTYSPSTPQTSKDNMEKTIPQEALNALLALSKIKEKYNKDKALSGTVECPCGGDVNYKVSSYNSHAWGSCAKCGLRFNE